MDSVTVGPDEQLEVDLEAREVHHRGTSWALAIPEGTRDQLLAGTWNATAVLLGAGDAIEATAKQLPYLSGFQA
jgi:3-isopropylmalate dehydratase small subunit